MRFNLTSEDYGPGRAGQNLVGEGDSLIVVEANVDSMVGYSQIENGIPYIVAHEFAHSLWQMQQFDEQMWNEYLDNAEDGLSIEELRAQYYASPQFGRNEARANTVARALAAFIGKPPMEAAPQHGYEDC